MSCEPQMSEPQVATATARFETGPSVRIADLKYMHAGVFEISNSLALTIAAASVGMQTRPSAQITTQKSKI